jgi:hypothetical protein
MMETTATRSRSDIAMATNSEDLDSDIKKPSCTAKDEELLDITLSVQRAIAV